MLLINVYRPCQLCTLLLLALDVDVAMLPCCRNYSTSLERQSIRLNCLGKYTMMKTKNMAMRISK